MEDTQPVKPGPYRAASKLPPVAGCRVGESATQMLGKRAVGSIKEEVRVEN